jgi:photosystem II stability/assembly factor-like uncharacterized protein
MEQTNPYLGHLTALCFIDSLIGTAISWKGVVRTTDGGINWILLVERGPTGFNYDVCFIDSNIGYVCGDNGGQTVHRYDILKTTDSGITWTVIAEDRGVVSICFADSSNGIAVGLKGTVLRTTDGGTTWYGQLFYIGDHFVDVGFADKQHGIILGYDNSGFYKFYQGMLRTTNGGNYWIPNNTYGPVPADYYAVSLADSNHGIVVNWYRILKTIDGGITWEHQEFPSLYFRGVSFIDKNHATVVGDGGIIIHTTDGGENWIEQQSNTTQHLRDVCFTDIYSGTVVGDSGTILMTTDKGNTWTQKASGTTTDLCAVSFGDSRNGWIVISESGNVLRTSDYGNSWTQQTIVTTELTDVCFTDSANGTVVGEAGAIERTSDGGDTWVQQISGITIRLNAVSFSDQYNGTAVGDEGVILRTTNGGVTFVEENEIDEIPSDYYLSNNFPNPFNPSTKIKYSVPQLSDVVIKVFDVLGNEIETLVDEEKQTGTYEITWYAEGLPSGVYVYRLQAGEYADVKKMMLLK